METSLAKRPANFMRAQTQAVRDHAAAMARCTDRYLAGLKRLEAQYFDDVKRITDVVTKETEPDAAPAESETASPAA
jgi:hypothetical protein